MPQSPAELARYLAGLTGKQDFDVVAVRHPDYAPEAYEEAGVSWLVDLEKP